MTEDKQAYTRELTAIANAKDATSETRLGQLNKLHKPTLQQLARHLGIGVKAADSKKVLVANVRGCKGFAQQDRALFQQDGDPELFLRTLATTSPPPVSTIEH